MSHLMAFYCLFGRNHAAMHFVKKRPFGELNTYVCIVFGLPSGFISQNILPRGFVQSDSRRSWDGSLEAEYLILVDAISEIFSKLIVFNRVKFKNKILNYFKLCYHGNRECDFRRPYIKIYYFRGTEPTYQFWKL